MTPFGNSIQGLPVIIAQPLVIPRLKLGDSINVSDEYRGTFDKWLLDTFGFTMQTIIPDGQVVNAMGRLIMPQATFDTLKEKLNDK